MRSIAAMALVTTLVLASSTAPAGSGTARGAGLIGSGLDSSLEARLLEHVRAITAAGRAERGAAIAERLRRLGIACTELPCPGGSNLEVRCPPAPGNGRDGDSSGLILGAHLDRVPDGEGAVDNAASCAILIELACELRGTPPAAGVRILFFDREEEGLRGSRSYLQDRREEIGRGPRSGYLNLDVNAYGDTIIYGPLGAGRGRMAALLELAARLEGLPVFGMAAYPPGDDISFRRSGIDAISSAILPRTDAAALDAFLSGRRREPPEILKVIHSDRDRIEQVEPAALARVLRLARRVVQLSGRRLERF